MIVGRSSRPDRSRTRRVKELGPWSSRTSPLLRSRRWAWASSPSPTESMNSVSDMSMTRRRPYASPSSIAFHSWSRVDRSISPRTETTALPSVVITLTPKLGRSPNSMSPPPRPAVEPSASVSSLMTNPLGRSSESPFLEAQVRQRRAYRTGGEDDASAISPSGRRLGTVESASLCDRHGSRLAPIEETCPIPRSRRAWLRCPSSLSASAPSGNAAECFSAHRRNRPPRRSRGDHHDGRGAPAHGGLHRCGLS